MPNAKVEIVDSLSATGGQGLLVLECCKMAENNLDFEEIFKSSTVKSIPLVVASILLL